MNRIPNERRTQIINCLVEGNSIRSTERLTNTHRDTIMRLGVEVGNNCKTLMDQKLQNLNTRRLQVDEIWAFVGKKQRHLTPTDNRNEKGDMWTFVALDPESKLVPAHRIGKRTTETALAFMADIASRLTQRIQLSSDALPAYVDACERVFGSEIDYGQSVKVYEAEPIGAGRYSPPKVIRANRKAISGKPMQVHISTSLIERQNLTMRMSMRRFTRLTNAFSKKRENLEAAVALHFAHYNFVRVHSSLRVTPAMAAGVTNHLWSLDELLERISN